MGGGGIWRQFQRQQKAWFSLPILVPRIQVNCLKMAFDGSKQAMEAILSTKRRTDDGKIRKRYLFYIVHFCDLFFK
jgi:hypothetical protein